MSNDMSSLLSQRAIRQLMSMSMLEPELLPVVSSLLENPLFIVAVRELEMSIHAEAGSETMEFNFHSAIETMNDAVRSVRVDMVRNKE